MVERCRKISQWIASINNWDDAGLIDIVAFLIVPNDGSTADTVPDVASGLSRQNRSPPTGLICETFSRSGQLPQG
jgi:hypothetical protein